MVNGTILTPAKAEFFDCGRQIHRLADEVFFGPRNGRLKKALFDFAGNHAYACIICSNGDGSFQPMSEWTTHCPEEKRDFMRALTVQLNTALDHGGAWITAWTNEGVLMALWFDRDGDLKFTLEDDRPWVRMLPAGLDYVLSNCAVAMGKLLEHERMLEITPSQQIKAAQGETVH